MLKSEDVLNWLIPSLLTAVLAVLGWMAISMNNISTSLAVVVHQVHSLTDGQNDHETRIKFLERKGDR